MLHTSIKMVTSNNNNDKASTSQSATLSVVADEPKNSEVFYPPGTSIIEAFAARGITNSQSMSSTSSIRTFIYGPSQSAKTSVAMDFAHSLACQYINNENNNNSKSVSSSEQPNKINGNSSDCSVIILRHRRNNSEKSAALFPMRCYCGSDSRIKRSTNNSKLDPNEWNEQALDTVTILYLESYSDLVQMLASIQIHFPSIHCLIIDDLDQFLPHSTTSNNSNEFTPTTNASTSLMIVQTSKWSIFCSFFYFGEVYVKRHIFFTSIIILFTPFIYNNNIYCVTTSCTIYRCCELFRTVPATATAIVISTRSHIHTTLWCTFGDNY